MFEQLFKYPLDEFRKGAAVLAAWYLYYRKSPGDLRGRTRAVLWALRGLALVLVVVVLCRLVLSAPVPQTTNVFVAVLVDDSRSMRIEDAGPKGALTEQPGRKSRWAAARQLLGSPEAKEPKAQEGLLSELAEACPVRLFKFSDKAQRIRRPEEVTASGDRTNLFAALSGAENSLRGVPVVGVVLVSDGAANTGGHPVEMARDLGLKKRPIYCVGLGDPKPPQDYEIVSVQCPREVRANPSVDIFASVRALGFSD
ncbi:MAG: hypothetical protein AMJ81_04640, partial [Phycisphaerae bacterium SM23_33]